VWRKGLGTTHTQADYDVWTAHFGETAGSGSGGIMASQNAVPEPASLCVCVVTGIVCLGIARSRSR